jgi:hypothetical protein
MTEEAQTTPAPGAATGTHFAAGVRDDAGSGAVTQDTEVDAGDGEAQQRTYTREEYEKGVQRRLARQERKLREDLKTEAEEQAKRERMDETTRLRTEKEESERKAQAVVKAAQDKLVLAEAKAQAAALGVPQDSLKYISRLVDISDVDVDVDGTPDEEAIREAVEQVLKDVPALAQREPPPEIEDGLGPQDPRSPIMPVGRDRTPDASRGGAGGGSNPDLNAVFNRRLRQRSSQR